MEPGSRAPRDLRREEQGTLKALVIATGAGSGEDVHGTAAVVQLGNLGEERPHLVAVDGDGGGGGVCGSLHFITVV